MQRARARIQLLSVGYFLASVAAHATESAATDTPASPPQAAEAPPEAAPNTEPQTATAPEATRVAPVAAPPAPCEPCKVASPAADPKANFKEHGRIGVIGALTEDMWKGGLVFEHEYFEVQVLAHYGKYSETDRDFHIIGKIGGRVPLGTLNYLAFGGEFGGHPGSLEAGQDVGGTYQWGPYIGLQRYFAATPVMLNLWVNPVQIDHSLHVDDTGAVYADDGFHIFQSGGFGIAYLF